MQEPLAGKTPREGRWKAEGRQICIRWTTPTPKGNKWLCRKLRTDDQGKYYKVVPRRKKKDKVVITYTSFKGPDGKDRRKFVSTGSKLWDFLNSGWGLGILGFGLLGLWWTIKGHKDDPKALQNRLWRVLFSLKAKVRDGDLVIIRPPHSYRKMFKRFRKAPNGLALFESLSPNRPPVFCPMNELEGRMWKVVGVVF